MIKIITFLHNRIAIHLFYKWLAIKNIMYFCM